MFFLAVFDGIKKGKKLNRKIIVMPPQAML